MILHKRREPTISCGPRSVTLHFKKANGEITTVEANVGDDIVDVSWEYDLDIEGALGLANELLRRGE